jgi:hypothetical protein
MIARRFVSTSLVVLGLSVGALALSSAPALAVTTHLPVGSFGPNGPGAGVFSSVGGVAVDTSTGDVYVLDAGAGSVYKFDSAGHPVNFAGSGTNVIGGTGGKGRGESEIAVDSSTGPDKGDIYVANAEAVRVYSAAGSLLGSLTGGETCGVAVDSSGDVYVGAYPSTVRKYTPVSNPVSNADETISIGGLTSICNVAVDGHGNLYAATYTGGVNKYEALQFGSPLASGTLVDERGSTLSVDPSSGDVYIDEGSDIAQYDSSESLLESAGANILSGSDGVAASGTGTGERIYAANGDTVEIYGPTVVAAEPTTQAASEVGKTTATLNGTVNPGGVAVSACKFEYRSETEAFFSHQASCSPAPGAGNASVAVSAVLSSLASQTTYTYRLATTNANGTSYGAEEAFMTQQAVDAVSTGSPTGITPDSARLTGSLSPDGTDAHYYFQYGKAGGGYESSFPALPGSEAGSGGPGCTPPGGPQCVAVAAEAEVAGLEPNTEYDYRLVAVNSFGTIYGGNENFTTPGPPRIEGRSSEAITRTGATLKATIDPDGFNTKYHFEYGETSSYGSSLPVPNGEISSQQEVSVEITGLTLGKTYHFRVVASNQAGPPVDGGDQELTTESAAGLDGEFATQVTASSASLGAEINPLGADTSYHFEYGLEDCGMHPTACTSVPSPEGDAGSGEGDQSVGAYLQGLAPSTTYHYRVVANNLEGIVEGADHTFTTQSAETGFALPEGREYEMVSPPNKDGAETGGFNIPEGGLEQASEDGSALAYVESGPVGENPPGNEQAAQILARRSKGGWVSQDITTPHSAPSNVGVGHGQEYRLFSSDLSVGLIEPYGQTTLSAGAPSNERNLYLWSGSGSGYEPLVTTRPNEKFTADGDELRVAGASQDLSHVVFTTRQALIAPAIKVPGENLYMWAAGRLQLVNVLPDNQPTLNSASLGDVANADTRNAVSANGSVVWTDDETEAIYVRNMVSEKTVLAGAGAYQTASTDGSKVFFIDNGALDEFDVNSDKLNEITPPDGAVQGVLGASDDGSMIYFVAQGALAQGAGAGADNLYESQLEGGSWKPPVLIATLEASDSSSWHGEASSGEDLSELTSRVSPNGRYVAFMSSASLTGYDNRDAVSGQPDVEVYLYDSAGAGHLVCASCNPSGARPVGEFATTEALPLPIDQSKAWDSRWLAASVPGWTRTHTGQGLYQPRYLSNSGRLFFDSVDGLVAHDTNGRLDVYEYVPAEVGGCTFVGGCVSLISAGTGSADSSFVDASASGSDVFFLTRDRLLSQDYDNSYDIYDAHLCSTSAPCIPPVPVSPPPCTTGDACKAAPTPQPAIFGAPASATFSGAGAPMPPAAVKVKKAKSKRKAKKRKPRAKRGTGGHKGKKARRSRARSLIRTDGAKR